ncbi:PQQ-binding-like beta-propeller repeat protein [Paenibacillus amylolyticus]|uniref:outer membrane protein assembly factor BamB family protein n=1 Tax=Paenibacillus amylolyticus TaxID=1451 RepID=UPI003879D80D
MSLKRINYWLIASLCFFLAIPSEPALAKDLLQLQWGYDITNDGQSATSSYSMKSVTDAMGNESLLVTKVNKNNDYYIDSVDAKTGELLWSIPTDNEYTLSDDGYMFIFHDNQVSAKHIATGQIRWTASLPGPPEDWRLYSAESGSPGENGSLYVIADSDDSKSSTLYYYDTNGNLSRKFKVPYFMQQIHGDVIVGSTFGDHPDLYLISLTTGKKIKTITGGKGYNGIKSLSDGTLLYYNIYKKTLTLKGYNSTGQLKWTKQLPYKENSTELFALKDRFVFVDYKNKRIKLYSSSGRLIAEKAYLPVSYPNMALDGTSLMFTAKKNGNNELIIMDTSNLDVLYTYKKGEFDLNEERLFLNNTTGLYILSDEGRTLVSTQLIK